MFSTDLENFMESLYDVGCVKFGEFVLSTGLKTPVYFDLRILVSFPTLLQQAARLIEKHIEENKLNFEIICGVPYGAFAIATAVSVLINKPMVFKRKEAKSYGCKKLVEGVYKPNDRCLLIEDVVVYGTSIIETTETLKDYNLKITDAITLLDREQGGAENIVDNGITFHSLIKASDLLEFLCRKAKISKEVKEETISFLKKHSYQASLHSNNNHISV